MAGFFVDFSVREGVKSHRNRVDRACDRCRAKKCKCDGNEPCKKCKESDFVCHYSSRKQYANRAVPRGYVDELELQQRYLIAGLRKLYCFLEEKDAWPGSTPSLRSDDGQPFIHDILASLDLLSENSYCGSPTNRLLCPQCGYDIHLQNKAAGSETDSPTIPTLSASIQSEDMEAHAEYMHTSPAAQLPTGMTWAPEDDRTSASKEPGPVLLPATGTIASQQSFVGPPIQQTGPFVYQPSMQEVLTLPSGDLVPNDLPPPGIDTSFIDLGFDSPWLNLGTYPLCCLNTNIVEMI